MTGKILFTLFLYVICSSGIYGNEISELYKELETSISMRKEISMNKEKKIDSIRCNINNRISSDSLYHIYFQIFNEYYTYRADSAFFYLDKAEEIAKTNGNNEYLNECAIYRSFLLSTMGHFSQSIKLLNDIDRKSLSASLLDDYYEAYEWVYSVWSEYTGDDVYAPQFRQKEILYTDSLLSVLPEGSARYHYWQGEYYARNGQQEEAEKSYMKALKGLKKNTRLYACVTCGIAFTHLRRGNMPEYKEYLIKSAISDMICPLKENLAMQELAMYIFKYNDGELETANRYLNISMEDAIFYNNRLRLLEIARKIPSVMNSYQKEIELKNSRITITLVFICILSIGLTISLIFIWKQIKQLRTKKHAVANMNRQLVSLNEELINTNRLREKYVSLFLDLCALYIDKLNKYQELVRRKIKAKQIDDLIKVANSSKMSENDAKHFFVNFDTAFLNLYPDFIKEFNTLLKEDEQIELKRGELLNTELRIFALIRMGIKDSSRIATLLFYSPQTIYNYRTSVRNKAKNREDFEEQVKKLCQVVEE